MSPAPFRSVSARPHSLVDASSLTVPSLCSLTEWTPPAVPGDSAERIHHIQQREVSPPPASAGQSPSKGRKSPWGNWGPWPPMKPATTLEGKQQVDAVVLILPLPCGPSKALTSPLWASGCSCEVGRPQEDQAGTQDAGAEGQAYRWLRAQALERTCPGSSPGSSAARVT